MALSLGLMIGGGLVALLGFIMLFTKMGGAKIIGGIVIATAGLACIGVGYTLDQYTEVTYTVVDITLVSVKDEDEDYRVTLRDENGIDIWVYVNDNQLYKFPKNEQVTMQKRMLKALIERE